MAYTFVEELGRSASLSDSFKISRVFIAEGDEPTDNEAKVLEAFFNQHRRYVYDGLQFPLMLQSVEVNAEERDYPTYIWRINAEYGPSNITLEGGPSPPETNKAEFAFNAAAPSGHIMLAKELISAIHDPQAPLQINPGLNVEVQGWDADLQVVGVDIAPPSPSFTVTWYPEHGILRSPGFTKELLDVVGKVNSEEFTIQGATFAPGELLVVSINGTRRTNEDWQVSIGFAYEANAFDLTFDPIPTPIDKKGHHYLWSRSAPVIVNNNSVELRYESVFVHRVYDEIDFSQAPGLSRLDGALVDLLGEDPASLAAVFGKLGYSYGKSGVGYGP